MFTPQSGSLELESFHGTLALLIRIQCAEPMDPDDPRGNNSRVTINIDGVPFSGSDHFALDGLNVDASEDEDIEASIYHFGYHNPVDLTALRFHSLSDSGVVVEIAGVIDFTFEGLSQLGTPSIKWSTNLSCDFDAFDSQCAQVL